MRKIIDYNLFAADAVHLAIKDGWQPWGSAIVSPVTNIICQPCVRYAPDPVEAILGEIPESKYKIT